jgi:hypothetical protein
LGLIVLPGRGKCKPGIVRILSGLGRLPRRQCCKLSDEDSQKFMLKVPLGTGEPAADADNT